MPSGTWPASSLPSNVAWPDVTLVSPASTSSSVDFPQPEGPTTVKSSPRMTSRSTGPSACTSAWPSWPGKTLVTPRRLIWPSGLAAMAGPAFNEAQQRVDARREDEQHQRDRHDVGHGMDVHGADQRKTEARGRGEQLADQHTEQSERDADPDAGENLRQRRRRHDGDGGAKRREPQHAGGAVIDRRDVAHRVHGEDGDRKDAVDHAERDLGGDAEAEDQENDRVERDLGYRVEGPEDRVGDVAGKAAQAEPQADRDAAGNRDDHGDAERRRGSVGVVAEGTGCDELGGAPDGRPRRGEHIGSDQPMHKLPQQQQAGEQQQEIEARRFHRWPKRRCNRFSQLDSAPLTAMTAIS